MSSLAVAGTTTHMPDAYGYLCHLQEMKQWLETCLNSEMPPVDELEERLRNGVALVRLGMTVLPGDPLWSKAYDLDESKYLARGLDFRHTDNINLWIQGLGRLGLPSVFYPGVTDVYERKNMPKLVYCVHALSHFLKKEGRTKTSVKDLYGEAEFSEKAVEAVQTSLSQTKEPVPSFEVVEDLVEEEIQYQGMDMLAGAVEEARKRLEAESTVDDAKPSDSAAGESEEAKPYEDVEKKAPEAPAREAEEAKPYANVEQKGPEGIAPGDAEAYENVEVSEKVNVPQMSIAGDGVEASKPQSEKETTPPPLPVKQKRLSSQVSASKVPVSTQQAPAVESLYDVAETGDSSPSAQQIYGELQCSKQGWTAVLYAKVNKEAVKKKKEELEKAGLSQLEAAVQAINKAVNGSDPQATYKALKADDAQLPQVFNEPQQYHDSLLAARRLAMPNSALAVYTGISRDDTERLLSSMSPGAYLVRRSGSSPSDHIVSFRNQTGIKHWKIGFEKDRYFWGNSGKYETLAEFVESFTYALQVNTKLQIYPGVSKELGASSTVPAEVLEMLKKLQTESGCSLTHEQIRQAVNDCNEKIKAQLKAMMSGGDEPNKPPPPAGGLSKARPTLRKSKWKRTMILAVNRLNAEQYLSKRGRPGSFVVRPSESEVGSYSISYRTNTEIKHWKAMKEGERFFIPPKPESFSSLEEVVEFFEKTVGSASGLAMEPLVPLSRSQSAKQQSGRQSQPLPSLPSRTGQQELNEMAPAAPPRSSSVSSKKAPSRSVSHWTVDDVLLWMQRVGLGDYAAVFKENEVDGACLEQISNEMLKNDLNVVALGHRQRILRKVQALFGN